METSAEKKSRLAFKLGLGIVALGVLMSKDNTVNQAGGFIIQLMPFAEEQVISELEKKVEGIASVTSLLEKGCTPELLLDRVIGSFGVQIIDTMPVQFSCGCSKEKILHSLATLRKNELKEMIDDGEPVEVTCHFCSSSYSITPDELRALL